MSNHSLEHVYEIWSDSAGYHYEVGPDRDDLDMVEIRYYEPASVDRKCVSRLAFNEHELPLLIEALQCAMKDLAAKQAKDD